VGRRFFDLQKTAFDRAARSTGTKPAVRKQIEDFFINQKSWREQLASQDQVDNKLFAKFRKGHHSAAQKWQREVYKGLRQISHKKIPI
jgi:hypothetical protein